jgi:tRNA (mo5U34)-methyltransferase
VEEVAENYDFWQTEMFDRAAYPKLHFIENRYADDPTNWWVPNAACAEAMLRSAGFEVVEHPEQEVYLCRRARLPDDQPRAVYPARRGDGR